MADTKGTSGESATNTRTVSSTGSSAADNTVVVSSGDTTGRSLSSRNAPDADLQDVAADKNPAKAGSVVQGGFLPAPHQGYEGVDTDANIYKDELAAIHRDIKRLESKSQDIEVSDEQEAARVAEQVRLAKTLRANMAARRTALSLRGGAENSEKVEGTVKVKLHKDHTDAGVFHKAHTEIKVDEPTAKFLEDNKIGERV